MEEIMQNTFAASLLFLGFLLALPAAAGTNTAESDLAYNTGRNFLADGRAELALERFKRSIELDDKNYFAYKGLGIAYAKVGNYKEAEKAQRKCLDLNPDFADARNDLGTTLMLMGRRDEARKEWMSAHSSPFNPTPDQTASNLGQSYLEERNYLEASRWFQKALQQNESSARAIVGLGTSFIEMNRLDEGIALLESSFNKGLTDPELLYALGDAYYRAGRFPEARTKVEATVKADPVGPWGRRASERLKHFPK
jgi:Flp pilus assembly protein TadD